MREPFRDELSAALQRVADLEEENQELQRQATALASENTRRVRRGSDRMAELEAENELLRRRVDAFDSERATADAETSETLATNRGVMGRVERERAEAQAELETARETLRKAQSELTSHRWKMSPSKLGVNPLLGILALMMMFFFGALTRYC